MGKEGCSPPFFLVFRHFKNYDTYILPHNALEFRSLQNLLMFHLGKTGIPTNHENEKGGLQPSFFQFFVENRFMVLLLYRMTYTALGAFMIYSFFVSHYRKFQPDTDPKAFLSPYTKVTVLLSLLSRPITIFRRTC